MCSLVGSFFHRVGIIHLSVFLPLLGGARGQVTKSCLLKEMQYSENVKESVSVSLPVTSNQ